MRAIGLHNYIINIITCMPYSSGYRNSARGGGGGGPPLMTDEVRGTRRVTTHLNLSSGYRNSAKGGGSSINDR